MMNPTVKKLWIDALRSEQYKQCQGQLKNDNSYCCLGVLCDIYIKEVKDGKWQANCVEFNKNDDEDNNFYDETLPPNVYKWAELNTDDPIIGPVTPAFSRGISACHANDEQKLNFNQIADLIEKNL